MWRRCKNSFKAKNSRICPPFRTLLQRLTMHSSPRFHFLLAFIGMALLGLPLWDMLHPSASARPDSSPVAHIEQEKVPAVLTVRFTGQPSALRITDQGRTVAALPSGESSPWETDIELPQDRHTAEWTVEAEWPAQTDPNGNEAVTLELEPPASDTRAATRWTTGSRLHDTFSFTW